MRKVYIKKTLACVAYANGGPKTVPRVAFFTHVLLSHRHLNTR